jgi:hypothetical protein
MFRDGGFSSARLLRLCASALKHFEDEHEGRGRLQNYGKSVWPIK